MDSLSRFRFAAAAATNEPAAHLVRIGAGVRRKRELLAQYDRALHLPDYFGWNWDALDEALRDLSWLAEPRRIVIVHADVPFAPHGKNRPEYLGLLSDLLADGAKLTAVFPPSAKDDIIRAIGG
jgi:hypothetical protein